MRALPPEVSEEPAARLGRALLYGTVWSVFTVVSVYTVMAHASRKHELVLAAFVAGFLLLTALSRALLGPHAARAAAIAFSPMVLISFGGSRSAQNSIVFGFGDWCGTGRLNDAIVSASMALPMGLCSMGLWYFLRLPSRRRTSARRPARPYVLMVLAAVLGLGAALAGVRSTTRASIEELRATNKLVESIPMEEQRSRLITTKDGHVLEVLCTTERPTVGRERPNAGSELRCDVSLELSTVESEWGAELRWVPVRAYDEVTVQRSQDGRVLTFGLLGGEAGSRPPLALLLDDVAVPYVRVGQLAPALGPRRAIAMLSALAALPLLALIGWVVRSRRRITTVMGGREGELDAEGRVRLGGDYLPVAAGLSGMKPGPVVVLRCVESEHYRATQSVSELLPGTQDALVKREVEIRKEWTPVAVVAAAVLAAPLVASATLGLL